MNELTIKSNRGYFNEEITFHIKFQVACKILAKEKKLKILLHYLRLIYNPSDNISFKRIINELKERYW